MPSILGYSFFAFVEMMSDELFADVFRFEGELIYWSQRKNISTIPIKNESETINMQN